MPQPKDKPNSLRLFELFCSVSFAIFLSIAFGFIYGPLNIPISIALGFGGSFLLQALFERQISHAYWWLRVWWELKVKDNDS
jgi:hypothetical protein